MVAKRLLPLLLLVLLLSPLSNAAPPTQKNVNLDTGYDLQYPKYEYIKQNSGFTLHMHIFNISDGHPLHNGIIGCEIHLYDTSGNHTFKGIMDYDYPEWEINIQKTNFSDLGPHPYTLWCNSSLFGGFASGVFTVTPTGLSPIEGFYFAIIITLSAALMFFLWFLFSDEKKGMKTLVLALGIGLTLLSVNIISGSLTSQVAYTSSQVALTIWGVLLFFYISVLLVKYTIEIVEKLKNVNNRGFGDDED